MTRKALALLTVITLMMAPASAAPARRVAPADPEFGNPQFILHLQEDLGIIKPSYSHRRERPCPTVRGVPIPESWGPDWQPRNRWLRHIDKRGYPPGQSYMHRSETPDRKWQEIVARYRGWLIDHRYDGSHRWNQMHNQFLHYLEQDWYDYWYRLRYGETPPGHDGYDTGRGRKSRGR